MLNKEINTEHKKNMENKNNNKINNTPIVDSKLNQNDNNIEDNMDIYNKYLKHCKYKIKDIEKLENCVSNELVGDYKIDLNNNIAIIDLSYWTYARFFAIRIWYNKTFSEKECPDDYNWCNDVIFMEKFEKLFFKKMFEICTLYKIPKTNIIFTVDCRFKDNWRLHINNNYKETRKASHKNNKFHNFEIFSFVRKILITQIQRKYHNLVLSHTNLEADDIVYLIINHLKKKLNYQKKFVILANDRDYIQICNDSVYLVDAQKKNVSQGILNNNFTNTDFLINKILSGDTSDNIESCYINKCFIEKSEKKTNRDFLKGNFKLCNTILESNECKNDLYNLLDYGRSLINKKYINYNSNSIYYLRKITKDNIFIKNLKLIDFECIPIKYRTEFTTNVLNKCFQNT